ncbi:MFS transporter [Cohnella suwonensis]|uniref:MFS transporter n=1 Tax=Cohnella suwonensis TaxID=696072 RepID=A0ABW0LNP5_9BACL
MARIGILLLTLGAFVTGTAELIVVGIQQRIADDLNITIGMAGQFVSAFSLAFAIGTPIVISITSRLPRKQLLVYALALFAAGSAASFFSTTFVPMLIARAVVGLSAGVFTVVAFGSASKLVPADRIGKAVGTVSLGISTSMVVGVPAGIAITDALSWQAAFGSLAVLAVLSLLLVLKYLPDIEGDRQVPFREQFRVLRNPVIAIGMIASFFFSSGFSSLYSYITPYVRTVLHFSVSQASAMMAAFGIASVLASRMGGAWADRWGTSRTIYAGLIGGIVSMAILQGLPDFSKTGTALLLIWLFSMSVAIPAIQTFFIRQSPGFSNLVLGLNTSVLHLGVAAGAGIGGAFAESSSSVAHHPSVSAAAALLSLTMAVIAVRRSGSKTSADAKEAT